MKKLTTLLMTLMLMSAALWAEETITVTANNSDLSEGLDLKVVAKLFAEAKNLEEFEMMLNNPDSAFCNLDLNGDGHHRDRFRQQAPRGSPSRSGNGYLPGCGFDICGERCE